MYIKLKYFYIIKQFSLLGLVLQPCLLKAVMVDSKLTRTAWAVFKYCGTKTVPQRMKKNL
jgi:hypothetical protein